MMCHNAPKDCDECHEKKNLGLPKMPDAYANILYETPNAARRSRSIPTGRRSMAQCIYCHPDLDAITPGRLIFAHAAHLQRNYKCTVCHPKFGHSESRRRASRTCCRAIAATGCSTATQGLVAGEECAKCHPKGFDLVPKNHTTAVQARASTRRSPTEDPAYCAMCHKPEFCVDCHTGKGTTPNASPKPVIPKDHTDAQLAGSSTASSSWPSRARAARATTGPSCQRCHKTPVPHPPNWIENHRPPAGIPASDCNICHRDRTKCQDCHHGSVKNGELIQRNCARGPGMKGCHVEMMQKPATAIKNKGFAEHAVHFDVKKTKGNPYHCYECHTDFGSSASAQKIEAQQGHDLRLCYSCHGALDPFNVQIAPYKGSSLCFRCHSDLNF